MRFIYVILLLLPRLAFAQYLDFLKESTAGSGKTILTSNAVYYNFKKLTGADAASISGGNVGFEDLGPGNYDLSPVNTPTVRRVQAIPSLRKSSTLCASMGTTGNAFLRASFELWLYVQTEDGQPSTQHYLFGHSAPGNPGITLSVTTSGAISFVYGNATNGFINKVTSSAVFIDGFNGAALLRIVCDFEADAVTIYKNNVVQASTFVTGGGGLSGLAAIDPLNYNGPNNLYVGSYNNNGTADSGGALGSLFEFAITPLIDLYTNVDLQKHFLTVWFNLGLGQSNDEGQAEAARLIQISPYTSRTPPGCFVYPKTTRTSTDDGSWQALNVGTNNRGPELIGSGSSDVFGDETPLMYQIYARTGQPVFWVKTSRGGSRLQPDGNPDWAVSSGELYLQATQYWWTIAKNKHLSYFPVSILKVVLHWHQGESDAVDATARANYQTNVTTLFTALRSYDGAFANAPLFITLLDFFRDANEATINTALTNYAAGDSKAYLINISSSKRKMDLTTGDKLGVTPTTSGGDDNHNSYLQQILKADLKYAQLITIGFIP